MQEAKCLYYIVVTLGLLILMMALLGRAMYGAVMGEGFWQVATYLGASMGASSAADYSFRRGDKEFKEGGEK